MATPQFNGLDDTPHYTENGAAATLDGDATITDPALGPGPGPYDGATLTLARQGGADPSDFIDSPLFGEGTIDVGGQTIAIFSNGAGNLTITFNQNATDSGIDQVLQSLRYQNTSTHPPASVTIDYTFNDGAIANGSITVGITAVDNPPTVDGTAPAYYQPGSAGAALAPNIQVADVDSPMLQSATVSIVQNFLAGDMLSVNVGNSGLVQHYGSNTGILTLTGAASPATYQQVLATVTYSSSVADPTSAGATATRTIDFAVSDGTLSADQQMPLGFTPVLDLDTVAAGTGYSTTFTVGGSGVAIANSNLHITRGDSEIQSATVVLTDAQAGDTLTAPGAPLPFTTDTSVPGKITLTFHTMVGATTASFEDAIKDVVFNSSSNNGITRDVVVDVNDVNNESNITHATITVNGGVNTPPADIAPTNTVPGAQTIEANTAAAIAGLSIADPDAGSGIETTTLSVAHGTLTVGSAGGAAVSGSGTSSVTLNGTVAQINTTLGAANNVLYHGAHDFFGTDTLTVVTNDNGNTGTGGPLTATDHVTLNVGPLLAGSSGNDSFSAPSGNERIDAGLGLDTISFNFKLVDATISWVGNQVIVDGPGGTSHTVLTGFEIYKFTDGTVNDADSDPLVDNLFYYSHYHDVWNAHLDANTDYHANGWHLGRDPSAFFSTVVYLSDNPDVKAAGIDPLVHFDQFGWKEGRTPSITFDPKQYLAANPDVGAAHVDPLAQFLAGGAQEGRQPFAPSVLLAKDGFDYVYYLQHNPDVAASGADPFQHFETVGWKEGRNPNALFDVNGYLAAYADVRASGANPLDHYHQFGWMEGRDPSGSFDTKSYLSHYPDVAATHVDPLIHFLQFGMQEGRSAFADGNF